MATRRVSADVRTAPGTIRPPASGGQAEAIALLTDIVVSDTDASLDSGHVPIPGDATDRITAASLLVPVYGTGDPNDTVNLSGVVTIDSFFYIQVPASGSPTLWARIGPRALDSSMTTEATYVEISAAATPVPPPVSDYTMRYGFVSGTSGISESDITPTTLSITQAGLVFSLHSGSWGNGAESPNFYPAFELPENTELASIEEVSFGTVDETSDWTQQAAPNTRIYVGQRQGPFGAPNIRINLRASA